MNAYLIFSINVLVLFGMIIFLDRRFHLLRDISTASARPYSLSRVQLAWWSIIIFSAIITVIFNKGIFPTLDQSTLILLGISSATAASARIVDLSDQNSTNTLRHQDSEKQGFFLDILSDGNGASIHRLQTVLFNIILGGWFVSQVAKNMANPICDINKIIPVVEGNNLIFLGISTATYVALKSSENKAQPPSGSQITASTDNSTKPQV